MFRMTSIVSLTAFALGMSAGRASPHPTRAMDGDPCALLTTAQVSAALGTAVEAGKPIAPNAKTCGWAPPGGPQIDAKKVTVTLITLKSFDAGKTPTQGIEKTALSGVGDDAVYITTGGFGTSLEVKKGNSAFQVRVGGFKAGQEKEIEKTLALEILKKL